MRKLYRTQKKGTRKTSYFAYMWRRLRSTGQTHIPTRNRTSCCDVPDFLQHAQRLLPSVRCSTWRDIIAEQVPILQDVPCSPCSPRTDSEKNPEGAQPMARNLLQKLIRDVLRSPLSTSSWLRFLAFTSSCLAKAIRGWKSHNLTTMVIKQVRQHELNNSAITTPSDHLPVKQASW